MFVNFSRIALLDLSQRHMMCISDVTLCEFFLSTHIHYHRILFVDQCNSSLMFNLFHR